MSFNCKLTIEEMLNFECIDRNSFICKSCNGTLNNHKRSITSVTKETVYYFSRIFLITNWWMKNPLIAVPAIAI